MFQMEPSMEITNQPTNQPTNQATNQPSNQPTNQPTNHGNVWKSVHNYVKHNHIKDFPAWAVMSISSSCVKLVFWPYLYPKVATAAQVIWKKISVSRCHFEKTKSWTGNWLLEEKPLRTRLKKKVCSIDSDLTVGSRGLAPPGWWALLGNTIQ